MAEQQHWCKHDVLEDGTVSHYPMETFLVPCSSARVIRPDGEAGGNFDPYVEFVGERDGVRYAMRIRLERVHEVAENEPVRPDGADPLPLEVVDLASELSEFRSYGGHPVTLAEAISDFIDAKIGEASSELIAKYVESELRRFESGGRRG